MADIQAPNQTVLIRMLTNSDADRLLRQILNMCVILFSNIHIHVQQS